MGDALAYIRVSSDDQADSGLGLEAQRQRIAAYKGRSPSWRVRVEAELVTRNK
jgi:DNA invertase Pin-like site-specific DNA recombinase